MFSVKTIKEVYFSLNRLIPQAWFFFFVCLFVFSVADLERGVLYHVLNVNTEPFIVPKGLGYWQLPWTSKSRAGRRGVTLSDRN